MYIFRDWLERPQRDLRLVRILAGRLGSTQRLPDGRFQHFPRLRAQFSCCIFERERRCRCEYQNIADGQCVESTGQRRVWLKNHRHRGKKHAEQAWPCSRSPRQRAEVHGNNRNVRRSSAVDANSAPNAFQISPTICTWRSWDSMSSWTATCATHSIMLGSSSRVARCSAELPVVDAMMSVFAQ